MPEYGNSGLSGLPAVVASFDPDLVRPVRHKPATCVKDFVLVSPFCGKKPELEKYLVSLDRLPCNSAHAVFYDNSCDREFQARLIDELERRFESYLLVEDLNRAAFVDLNRPIGPERMKEITRRIGQVYSVIYEQFVPSDIGLVLNLEDDIEVPPNCFQHLTRSLLSNEQIGTVIATCHDRRIEYGGKGFPIAFAFEYSQKIGSKTPSDVELIRLEDKAFGLEAIGGGHMGCWLSRAETLHRCPMGESELFGIKGHDLVWGWRLHEQGYIFANDWSLRCRHWFTQNKRLQSV